MDLDLIERLARACVAGGRAAEIHPFRPNERVLVDDDGDGLAEGQQAEIELMAALPPAMVLHLIAIVRAAADAEAV